MGEKSAQKRQYILDVAKQTFMDKGFKSVTMKDIVDACGISRGGLYLYFESTDQIFMEVLKMEQEDSDDSFARAVKKHDSIAEIIGFFLKEQKKELLRTKNTLTIATYEYYFKHQTFAKNNNIPRQQFEAGVKILERLIQTGNESGEFCCPEPQAVAWNIMLVLEGFKISSNVMGITEEMVDRQLVYIMSSLLADEE